MLENERLTEDPYLILPTLLDYRQRGQTKTKLWNKLGHKDEWHWGSGYPQNLMTTV